VPAIDFKETLLANNYAVTETFPLAVNRCTECFHLQLAYGVDPKVLFSDYPYRSGVSKTFVDFCEFFANLTIATTVKSKDGPVSKVLDIACNDGTQLNAFKGRGLDTYGVDPAENVTAIAKGNGHTVFQSRLEDIGYAGGHIFDILTAQNVLAHTTTPLLFLQKCRQLMGFNSRLFLTTSQANLVLNTEFDSIYHEHISYFNARSLEILLNRAGLYLLDLQTNPIHGTSYIAIVGKEPKPQRISARAEFETDMGLYLPGTYSIWEKQVRLKIEIAKRTIEEYRNEFTVVGCGAAAKGITFLNIAGIKPDHLLDTTPAKWGKTACGVRIERFDKLQEFPKEKKLLLLILAWNFEREVRKNIARMRQNPNDLFLVLK